MSGSHTIAERKEDHIAIALGQPRRSGGGFEHVRFEHVALPELSMEDIDLGTAFLGWPLQLPFLISSMTGGPERGGRINVNLATAAEALQIPFGVGSQRIALEGVADAGMGRDLRKAAPTAPILANLGAAQLAQGYGSDHARRAIDMIDANALIVHLNPLQEAIQPAGDRDWRGILNALEGLCATLDRPVIVKEVGSGISAPLANRLHQAGVAAVDVAGLGGTAWAAIEAERCTDPRDRAVGEAFIDWGIPTAMAIRQARTDCPSLPLIGSGGIGDGVDAAKALRLGADLVGQAAGVLNAALVSPEAVIGHFEVLAEQLRIACFCTGSKDLIALKAARLSPVALAFHDL